jgi:hypothetical protein
MRPPRRTIRTARNGTQQLLADASTVGASGLTRALVAIVSGQLAECFGCEVGAHLHAASDGAGGGGTAVLESVLHNNVIEMRE